MKKKLLDFLVLVRRDHNTTEGGKKREREIQYNEPKGSQKFLQASKKTE